ncbi:hypothetical protein SAMN04487894_103109 [Niabella drilacis]|uniref:Uncharacterized protein n=1 Tax=Niabella drilacis (strain DSM 25811 / CCM 8410 / CCUG 62505 / LMG 26954 / E90) TaxID=1285928 RepID=A0A1G6N1T1_NIADE|nr:hypothetical protein SAMN04487894_103109 [Niabella drilacis]
MQIFSSRLMCRWHNLQKSIICLQKGSGVLADKNGRFADNVDLLIQDGLI